MTGSVPDVKLGGVDNGNGFVSPASTLRRLKQAARTLLAYLLIMSPRNFPGQTAQQIIDEMLSTNCDTVRYPACYNKLGAMAKSHGFSYRFSEGNSHVATPALVGGNHSFATALFALDYLHWWAAHGCLGVHFHTGMGLQRGVIPRHERRLSTISNHLWNCGLQYRRWSWRGKFSGGQNPDSLNLTAYAVTDSNHDLLVTIINRKHGENARDGIVTINMHGKTGSVMYLKVPNNDVTNISGVTSAALP